MGSSVNMLPKLQKDGTLQKYRNIYYYDTIAVSESSNGPHKKMKVFYFLLLFFFSDKFVPVLYFNL